MVKFIFKKGLCKNVCIGLCKYICKILKGVIYV